MPVVGYSGNKKDALFGINLTGGQHMEVVKIDKAHRERDKNTRV